MDDFLFVSFLIFLPILLVAGSFVRIFQNLRRPHEHESDETPLAEAPLFNGNIRLYKDFFVVSRITGPISIPYIEVKEVRINPTGTQYKLVYLMFNSGDRFPSKQLAFRSAEPETVKRLLEEHMSNKNESPGNELD